MIETSMGHSLRAWALIILAQNISALIILAYFKARLHDMRFGHGTLNFWHADLCFLARLLHLHGKKMF